ncbi:MAG: FIG01033914: hypothetical protein, partial [uncultured Thermomicrobiales bacterium]
GRRRHRQDGGQRWRQRLHPDHRRPRLPRGPAGEGHPLQGGRRPDPDRVVRRHRRRDQPARDDLRHAAGGRGDPDRRAAADRRLRDERRPAARGHRPHLDGREGRRWRAAGDGRGRDHRPRRRPLRADEDAAADHRDHPRREVPRPGDVLRRAARLDGPLQRDDGPGHRRRARRDRAAGAEAGHARPVAVQRGRLLLVRRGAGPGADRRRRQRPRARRRLPDRSLGDEGRPRPGRHLGCHPRGGAGPARAPPHQRPRRPAGQRLPQVRGGPHRLRPRPAQRDARRLRRVLAPPDQGDRRRCRGVGDRRPGRLRVGGRGAPGPVRRRPGRGHRARL